MASTPTTNRDLTPSNFQTQSPLFGDLPGEIRNEIFSLVLIQYEDEDEAYPEESYWYRPGFRGPRKSSSALLRTCKLAYAEGKKVFLRGLEWAFWFHRGPPHRTGQNAFDSFFTSLSPSASTSLSHVRLFTQMYWLESGHNLLTCLSHPNFHASTLTITIRYSDWWNWEADAPLTMNVAWLRRFRGNAELREMRVEYETLSRKREEMMRIVERNKGVEVGVRGGEGYLSARGGQLEEWRWRGTSRVGGRVWGHHGREDTVEYVVVRDTWRWVEGEMEGGREGEGEEWDSDEEEEEEEEYLDEDGDWNEEEGEEGEEGEEDSEHGSDEGSEYESEGHGGA